MREGKWRRGRISGGGEEEERGGRTRGGKGGCLTLPEEDDS